MFKQLGNLAYQRNKLEALGFYIAYLITLLIVAVLASSLYSLITGSDDFDTGVRIGNIIAILFCISLAAAICAKKKIRNFKTILLVLLSGVGAVFLGGLLGLIPVAILSTFKSAEPTNAPSTEDISL